MRSVTIMAMALVSAWAMPARADTVFFEDFDEDAGNWDNGSSADDNRPAGKYDNLIWNSPNVNADDGTGSGNDSDADGVWFANTFSGGAATVLADATFTGDLTVSADMTSTIANIGISIGDLYILFHPGNSTGALRVQRLSNGVQLIGNQNVGFTPENSFDEGLHHLEVVVDTTAKELDITLTDGTVGNSSTPFNIQVSYADGDYMPGVDNVGIRRGGSGVAWFDNFTVEQVPEPATLALLAVGGLGIVGRRMARRRT